MKRDAHRKSIEIHHTPRSSNNTTSELENHRVAGRKPSICTVSGGPTPSCDVKFNKRQNVDLKSVNIPIMVNYLHRQQRLFADPLGEKTYTQKKTRCDFVIKKNCLLFEHYHNSLPLSNV